MVQVLDADEGIGVQTSVLAWVQRGPGKGEIHTDRSLSRQAGAQFQVERMLASEVGETQQAILNCRCPMGIDTNGWPFDIGNSEVLSGPGKVRFEDGEADEVRESGRSFGEGTDGLLDGSANGFGAQRKPL